MKELQTNGVSPAAAKKILAAINFKLDDYGFADNKAARSMAVGIASSVKRIVLQDTKVSNGPTPAA